MHRYKNLCHGILFLFIDRAFYSAVPNMDIHCEINKLVF